MAIRLTLQTVRGLRATWKCPLPGAYRFYVALDKQNAEAELRFDHLPDPVFLSGAAAADNAVLGDQPSEFLELKSGIPYRFTLGSEEAERRQRRGCWCRARLCPRTAFRNLRSTR